MVRTGDKACFDDRCALARRAKQRICRVWSRSRMQADWKEYQGVRRKVQLVSINAERAFTECSQSPVTLDECTKSMEVVAYS